MPSGNSAMTKPRALVLAVALAMVCALSGARPAAADQPAPPPVSEKTKELRAICSQAMNADPSFANDIITTVNRQTAIDRLKAGERIARDERQVILAYAAMWIAAAGFLVFLWWRQRGLEKQIAQLEADLAAATKEAT